jgi:hypothetical protein
MFARPSGRSLTFGAGAAGAMAVVLLHAAGVSVAAATATVTGLAVILGAVLQLVRLWSN